MDMIVVQWPFRSWRMVIPLFFEEGSSNGVVLSARLFGEEWGWLPHFLAKEMRDDKQGYLKMERGLLEKKDRVRLG